MIQANNVGLQFGGRSLFAHVDITFNRGNCYGLIGANGAGKSTFLKILSGEIEPDKGEIFITPGERLSVLEQNHFKYDDCDVTRTVLLGNRQLVEIMDEKEVLYAKEDFSEEDGMRISELEEQFAEMDGWSAESDAEILLNGLGVTNEFHTAQMAELSNDVKVKVLLAQAIFGNPAILLMDEPTNHLDVEAIHWLEDFLQDLQSTVIVVSHDRHFLNQVCTHTVDIDYGKITMFMGNYDFWYNYTQIAQRQLRDQNKKSEQKIKELQEFIQRFSANASKSKQATSRKKLLDNLIVEDLPVSTRRFPYIAFTPDRAVGNELLTVVGLTKKIGDRLVLDHVNFTIQPREKVAFVGTDAVAKTTLFKILAGELEPDEGTVKWGVTTSQSYFPTDNGAFFDGVDDSLIDWVRRYSNLIFESDVRGWLGRLLFQGDESTKKAKVLSGGERVRMMLVRMMLSGANVLLLDEPTNHLDLESIQSLNEGLQRYPESVLFASHDHQFAQTIANRIIDVSPGSFYDKKTSYDAYLQEMHERTQG
ncbi:MAG: ATP-binding cassette domain-containing protein [Oscillospiraceae bacterium]|jgi:ATPase subunit of ABC transporter with duplicated ATPase domains|nr:ATP-binding cassette domain-containing protein [Oscillospiraceae bacterium]